MSWLQGPAHVVSVRVGECESVSIALLTGHQRRLLATHRTLPVPDRRRPHPNYQVNPFPTGDRVGLVSVSSPVEQPTAQSVSVPLFP